MRLATGRGRSSSGSSSCLPSTFASIALGEHFGVGVEELLALPLVGERVDEPVGEIHLLLRPALAGFRKIEILWRSDLVGETHHRKDQGVAGRLDGGDVLALAQNDGADANPPGILQ